jgi:hypothetical protein
MYGDQAQILDIIPHLPGGIDENREKPVSITHSGATLGSTNYLANRLSGTQYNDQLGI